MNRRQFTAGLGALAAAPTLPVKALASAPAAGAIPNTARFWAIYMSHLHGVCTPEALAKISGVTVHTAKGYLSTLISDGVITTTRMAAAVHNTPKPSGFKRRLEKLKKDRPVQKTSISEKGVEPEDDSHPINQDAAELQNETDIAATESNASATISENTTGSH
ncbi:hypothetical protein F9L33_13860 [Amylibacter sp. SFDW26]|uniref:hypothetical protein n=1 Tax=Amylibacter sp. SFDW26 TaxID=2652722 RepID=UPI0012617C1D|nr:hypothetical protein [Amylibacter sp. SFDW26]KAB7610382.1 hypothetical protein F9L33_13860 [Amylibacter sp. SFDW26]